MNGGTDLIRIKGDNFEEITVKRFEMRGGT